MRPWIFVAGPVLRPCLLFAGLMLSAGCYQSPSDFPTSDVIRIETESVGPVMADGQSMVTVVVRVDERTSQTETITVTTSSGILNVAASPTSEAARTITARNPGNGEIRLQLEVGNVPGPTTLEASIRDYRSQAVLMLEPSPPIQLELRSDVTSLEADGESDVDVTVLLAAAGGALVSVGTRVHFQVCCADDQGASIGCPDVPPLQLISFSDLATGQSLKVNAVTERLYQSASLNSDELTVWVIAEVFADGEAENEVDCGEATPDAVRDEAAFKLLLLEPSSD